MFYRFADGLVSVHQVTLSQVAIDVLHAESDAVVRCRNEWHTINVLLSGDSIKNEITMDGLPQQLHQRPPGSLMFVPACAAASMRSIGRSATYCLVRISPVLIHTVSQSATHATVLPLRSVQPFFDPRMQVIVERMAAMTESESGSFVALDASAQALASLVVKRFAGEEDDVTVAGGLSPSRMLRVVELVRDKLAAPITLEDMADAAGLSVDRFRHAFKVSAGVSPYRYLMSERVKRANDLLADTDKPLIDVALECGFGSQSHFTSTFRSIVGLSPGAFRRARSRMAASVALACAGLCEWWSGIQVAAEAVLLAV